MTTKQTFTFRLCATGEEKKEAYRLVNESYTQGGLIVDRARDVFTSKEGVDTLVALDESGEIVGTVSFALDTGEGSLPIDLLFSEEMREMREANYKLCEVTCLSTKKDMPTGLVLALTRESIRYCMETGIDYLLAEVSPRHLKLYTDMMLFTLFGKEKIYRSSEGDDWADNTKWNPIRLDLRDHDRYKQEMKEKKPSAYQYYFA